MVRHKSRSRSRSRDRKHRDRRSRSRSRDRDRKRDNKDKDRVSSRHQKSSATSSSRRSRTRSRSPRSSRKEVGKSSHRRERERSSSNSSGGSPDRYGTGSGLTLGNVKPKFVAPKKVTNDKTPIILDPKELEGKSVDEIEMLKVMGFTGFDTTKGKHVDGACNAYAVNIQQKRKYRQYMNRKGGFNKPLDPVA